jgi:hypothetical protein
LRLVSACLTFFWNLYWGSTQLLGGEVLEDEEVNVEDWGSLPKLLGGEVLEDEGVHDEESGQAPQDGVLCYQFAPWAGLRKRQRKKKGRLTTKGIVDPGEASGGCRLSKECEENTTAEIRDSLILECRSMSETTKQGDLR